MLISKWALRAALFQIAKNCTRNPTLDMQPISHCYWQHFPCGPLKRANLLIGVPLHGMLISRRCYLSSNLIWLLPQAFYLYLYSASLLFLLYVYIYLLSGAPKLDASRKYWRLCTAQYAVHLFLVNWLTRYVRIGSRHFDCKKSKISETDRSHASIFLRIGSVVFGLGVMIYNGLEFGAFFEIPQDSPCYAVLLGEFA